MDCGQTGGLSNKEYLQHFNRKVIRERIPLSGTVDFTHRCNLNCVHCYLGSKRISQDRRHEELSTAQWLSLIDQFLEAGCLFLLITGGEPLLREDFAHIYGYAKKSGLLVTVFTNGTLVTDEIADLFEDLPPQGVEITLYGATAETYEKITGVKGSYEQCLQGMEKLRNRQIRLSLKTVLMTLNHHEFHDIENMAKDHGVTFRCDAAISPCLNGNSEPIRLRLNPREAVQIEFSSDDRARRWRDYFYRMQGLPETDALYNCGAGMMSFHVDPYGNLQPCLMVDDLKYSLCGGNFLKGWRDVIPHLRDRKATPGYPCSRCEKRALCGSCPAFSRLENGAEDVCSEYLCAIGEHRFQRVKHWHEKDDIDEIRGD